MAGDCRRAAASSSATAWAAAWQSLPVVSLLGMIWLWHDRPDATNMAAHSQATFWFVPPSLPMFLLIPGLLRHGVGFWPALAAACGLTILLYFAMVFALQRLGIAL